MALAVTIQSGAADSPGANHTTHDVLSQLDEYISKLDEHRAYRFVHQEMVPWMQDKLERFKPSGYASQSDTERHNTPCRPLGAIEGSGNSTSYSKFRLSDGRNKKDGLKTPTPAAGSGKVTSKGADKPSAMLTRIPRRSLGATERSGHSAGESNLRLADGRNKNDDPETPTPAAGSGKVASEGADKPSAMLTRIPRRSLGATERSGHSTSESNLRLADGSNENDDPETQTPTAESGKVASEGADKPSSMVSGILQGPPGTAVQSNRSAGKGHVPHTNSRKDTIAFAAKKALNAGRQSDAQGEKKLPTDPLLRAQALRRIVDQVMTEMVTVGLVTRDVKVRDVLLHVAHAVADTVSTIACVTSMTKIVACMFSTKGLAKLRQFVTDCLMKTMRIDTRVGPSSQTTPAEPGTLPEAWQQLVIAWNEVEGTEPLVDPSAPCALPWLESYIKLWNAYSTLDERFRQNRKGRDDFVQSLSGLAGHDAVGLRKYLSLGDPADSKGPPPKRRAAGENTALKLLTASRAPTGANLKELENIAKSTRHKVEVGKSLNIILAGSSPAVIHLFHDFGLRRALHNHSPKVVSTAIDALLEKVSRKSLSNMYSIISKYILDPVSTDQPPLNNLNFLRLSDNELSDMGANQSERMIDLLSPDHTFIPSPIPGEEGAESYRTQWLRYSTPCEDGTPSDT